MKLVEADAWKSINIKQKAINKSLMFTQITTSLRARKTINNGLNFTHLFGTKYSRMNQVKFVGDSL